MTCKECEEDMGDDGHGGLEPYGFKAHHARISSLEAEVESYKATLELLPMYNQVVARAEAAEKLAGELDTESGMLREALLEVEDSLEKAVQLLQARIDGMGGSPEEDEFFDSLEKT